MAGAWASQQFREARNHARALLDWLNKDGFPPTITGHANFDRELTYLAAKQIYG
jgi:hypothetical protein